ncbi:MAG: oligosaccharide flippase family protein [bacterium]|nr:oligosaccharide flippase family protein [bacterium]
MTTFRDAVDHLRTLVRRHGRDAAWLTSSTIATLGAQAVLAVVLARLVSVEGYGAYRALVSAFGIALIGFLPGMEFMLVRDIARGSPSGGLLTRWMLPASVLAGVAFALLVPRAIPADYHRPLLWMTAALFPAAVITRLPEIIAHGRSAFRALARIRLLVALAPPLATLAVAWKTKRPESLFLGTMLGTVAATLPFLGRTSLRSLWTPASPASVRAGFVHTVVRGQTTLRLHLSQLLVGSSLGFDGLALYSVAVLLLEALRSLEVTVHTLSFPRFAIGTPDDGVRALRRSLPALLLGWLGVAVLAAGAAPFLLRLTFPPPYHVVALPTQLLLLGTVVLLPSLLFQSYLRAHDGTRTLLVSETVATAGELGALALLLPAWGITGAVGAKLIGFVLLSSLQAAGVFKTPRGSPST